METEPKNRPSNRPKGRKRTEGDRRGSRAQGPGTKTEAGNRLGEQDRARPDLHRHHKPGRRKRGPKEPQSRSRSHARESASATLTLNTRMTASTSQRRYGATARVQPTTGHATDGSVNQGPHPRAQASGARRRMEIDDLTTSEPGTNKNSTHRQTMRRPKQARKTDRYPRVKTFSHAISLALTGPGQ